MKTKELTIKGKGLEYFTLSRGATIVDLQNRKTRTIIKKVYDTTFFGIRKVLRESKIIAEIRDSAEYSVYNQLMREMLWNEIS